MINLKTLDLSYFTHRVKALLGKLHHCVGIWRYYTYLKESNLSAQLRLAIHQHSSTLYPAQLRILGL